MGIDMGILQENSSAAQTFTSTQKLVKDKVQKRTRLLPFIQVDRTSNWMNPLVVSNPSMLKKEKAASGSYIRSRGPHFRACRIEGPRGAKKYTTSFCCPSKWIKTPVTCSEELIDLKRMRYPLLAVLLVTVCRSSYGQPCKICKPPSADKICTPTEPMTLPAKLVVQSSICNDIETKYKDYQKTLCKTYSGGYYCECTDPQDGNVYSCRSSCGPPLEDIGKGLNLDLLQNNLLSDGNLFANNNKSGGQPNPFDFGKFNGRNPSANFGNFDSLDNLFSNLNPGTPNNRRRRPFSGGGSGSQSKPVSGGSFPSGPRASGFGPSQFDESFGKRNFKPVFNNPSSLGSSGPNPVKTTGS
ncbi:hypothetical protein C0Q70_06691 [Pomacea canaliculata]|uniref:Uncharacterized protein n=1 Tax=Pomacea canaliculata TaxID=400727 RepID=A0A2T7PCZ7_POMCA|nr:hypothetical protein C0Q70_06691 [Pomacea canaliculata]